MAVNIETITYPKPAPKFRVGIIERGTNGPLVFNGLTFATWDEANEYGQNLLARWSGASAYRVEEITNAPL